RQSSPASALPHHTLWPSPPSVVEPEILLSNHLGNDPRLLEIVLDRIRAIGTADQGSSILKP
ncbi:MAG: hypothetical protein M1553_02020, partial [Firmicutes bacterium]|nr:hypothetical protein [Bacillota bacterium]